MRKKICQIGMAVMVGSLLCVSAIASNGSGVSGTIHPSIIFHGGNGPGDGTGNGGDGPGDGSGNGPGDCSRLPIQEGLQYLAAAGNGGSGDNGGNGPGDGTGNGGVGPADGSGNGPGTGAASGNGSSGDNGGHGPGDGTGNDGDGPADGTGNGPGDCL